MVAESMFGTVQYGDVKVHFAPTTQDESVIFYQPSTVTEANESLPAAVKQEEGVGGGPDASSQRSNPNSRKDDSYWDRRRRNNEAAKRSREKRRFNDMMLESRVAELTKDNFLLRAQLNTIRDKFGIIGENHIDVEQVLAQLPPVERILGFSKRPKALTANRLLQLGGSTDTKPFSLGSASANAVVTSPLRPVTPPSAPICSAGREPAPFVYRQQSLREVPQMDSPDLWRPRSADAHQRLTPEFSAAVNLTKPPTASERRASPPAGEWCALPLKLRHKTHLSGGASPPRVKEEPHDSASSGDERDSALSERSGYSDGGATSPACKRRRPSEEIEEAPVGGQIRSELQRLSSEVATLRCLLNRQQTVEA